MRSSLNKGSAMKMLISLILAASAGGPIRGAQANAGSSVAPTLATEVAESTLATLGVTTTREILPAIAIGLCLDVQDGSMTYAFVQQYYCHGGDMQKWIFDYAGDGKYLIRAKHSGYCLDVDGASMANHAPIIQAPCHGRDNQLFRISVDSSGAYEIRAVHSDKCLDVPDGRTTPRLRIQQYQCHGGDMQRFYLR